MPLHVHCAVMLFCMVSYCVTCTITWVLSLQSPSFSMRRIRASFWHCETSALRRKSYGLVDDVTLAQVLRFLSVKTAPSPKSRNPFVMAVVGTETEGHNNMSHVNGWWQTDVTRITWEMWSSRLLPHDMSPAGTCWRVQTLPRMSDYGVLQYTCCHLY